MWDRPLAISSIPYGHLAGQPFGLWCVGDQDAVIPSFTGDGMSITLHSAALATEMYLAGESAERYNHRLHAQLSRGMNLATCLSRSIVTKTGRSLALFVLLFFQVHRNGSRYRPVFRDKQLFASAFFQEQRIAHIETAEMWKF